MTRPPVAKTLAEKLARSKHARYDTGSAIKPFYSMEQKLMAVEIIRQAGGTIGKAQVAAIRALIGSATISQPAIRQWWLDMKDVPPADVLKEAYGEWVTPEQLIKDGIDPRVAASRAETATKIHELVDSTAELYLEQARKKEVVEATKGRDAVWSAAVLIDKSRAYRNIPTEILDILPSIVDKCREKNLNPKDVFQQLYAMLLREPVHGDE